MVGISRRLVLVAATSATVVLLPAVPAVAATVPTAANLCEHNGSCDDSVTWLVRSGQTLWSIAAAHFGDGSRWRELAVLNHISDPRTLRAGVVLRLR